MASVPVSPSLTRTTTSETDSTGNLTPTATWTSEQEVRLAYCQDQLKQAQKKWSDRQELWIREVEHLLELKRAHKKAQKRQKAHADKTLRKTYKTWRPLSRTQSSTIDTTPSTPSGAGISLDDDDDDGDEGDGEGEGDGDDGDEVEEEEVSLTGVRRSGSLVQQTSISTSISTPSSPTSPTQTQTTTTNTNRNPFRKIIRRMSSASFRGSRG